MTTVMSATEIADAIVVDWVRRHHLDPHHVTEMEALAMMRRMMALTEYSQARARAYITAALRRFRFAHITA